MSNKHILITGGTGLVGTALASYLADKNYTVTILSRNPQKADSKKGYHPNIHFAHWDVAKQQIDKKAIQQADAIVHLAGAGVVDKPWTDAYKKEIVESRVKSSALLIKALQEIPNRVNTVISTSAIGYYGADKGGQPFTETDPPVRQFLGETCRLWEESIQPVKDLGKRLVINRFGIVLSHKGGALMEFKKPLQARVAAILGSGTQMISWIHIDDVCRMIEFELMDSSTHGVYNAVAPNPVTNRQLTITLAKAMHGNAYISMHVPAFALKLVMGDRSIEVLKSATVSAEKILDEGFEFKHAVVEHALTQKPS